MKIKFSFRRKSVPSTPCKSPTQDRVQAWVEEPTPPSTQSVLSTIFCCFKSSRPSTDHPPKVPSSSSLSTSLSNGLPDEDAIHLSKKPRKPKRNKGKRNKSGKKRGTKQSCSNSRLGSGSKQEKNVHSNILHDLDTKSKEVDGLSKEPCESCTNPEYIQSATTSKISSSTNDTEKKRDVKFPHLMQGNHHKIDSKTDTSSSTEIDVHQKELKYKIIKVKPAEQSNITSSKVYRKNTVSSLLTRQTAEQVDLSLGGTESLPYGNSNFHVNEQVSENPGANYSPRFNEADLIRVLSPPVSASSPGKGAVKGVADHSAHKEKDTIKAISSKSVYNSQRRRLFRKYNDYLIHEKPCLKIDRPWLAAMGGIGTFNSGSNSLRRVETEEKPFSDMSYEERELLRSKYCLHIQQQRENVSRLQKRQQKVHGNVEELTNAISRVKRSLVRCKDFDSTYAVELRIINLDQKRSSAKEGIRVLKNEINQRMLKTKELISDIAELKRLNEEYLATRDVYKELKEFYFSFQCRRRPLGARVCRLRRPEYIKQERRCFSFTQEQLDSGEVNPTAQGITLQYLMDEARKFNESLPRGGCTPSHNSM